MTEKKIQFLMMKSALKSALGRRDKLPEYDHTVEKRIKVIDVENDYFQTDSELLSEKEVQILEKKNDEIEDLMYNRQKQKCTLDFAGRKVKEEKPDFNIDMDKLLKPDTSISECQDASTFDIPSDLCFVYQEDNSSDGYYQCPVKEENNPLNIRIQYKNLQEISDEGHCLCVRQPYASLLVAGIKRHEGRVWYASHRGRLWIHSSGKPPTKREIYDLENMYRHIHGNCDFPKTYPHGCLLGCVDLVACLPQEEYKIQYPVGEIASPYVYICENAKELSTTFPMKGKQKIFKLDSNIHQAAKEALKKI